MKYVLLILLIAILGCNHKTKYDTIIRNGLIYDGNGGTPYKADIAINADTIAFIGQIKNASTKNEINADGKAVAPGFINMMGHSEKSLFQDGRSQSDIRQGVTTEIFTESSFGPLNADDERTISKKPGRYKV